MILFIVFALGLTVYNEGVDKPASVPKNSNEIYEAKRVK